MGFHPKNGLASGMKVRLSIWTLWNCFKKTGEVVLKLKIVKTEINSEKVNFEDLGH